MIPDLMVLGCVSHGTRDDGSGALYSKQYGAATGPAARQGSIWTRNYEHATVSVDCATLEPKITMAHAHLSR